MHNTKYNLQKYAILCIIFYIKSDFLRLSATFFTSLVVVEHTLRVLSLPLLKSLAVVVVLVHHVVWLLRERLSHKARLRPLDAVVGLQRDLSVVQQDDVVALVLQRVLCQRQVSVWIVRPPVNRSVVTAWVELVVLHVHLNPRVVKIRQVQQREVVREAVPYLQVMKR